MAELEMTPDLPARPVLEERFIEQTAVGKWVEEFNEYGKAYRKWTGSRWFVAKVHRRRTEIAVRKWRVARGKPQYRGTPIEADPGQIGGTLFEAWAFEAYRERLIGSFVWIDRAEMGFVELPVDSLVQGKMPVALLNSWSWEPVAYLNDPRVVDLCKRHGVFIEREFEVSRRDVTKAIFGDAYRAFEVLERIEG